MTDYFALLGEARRPWLEPENVKEKYFARARERLADAELNEAFRVLSDPKLRLQHLLALEGIDLKAGRDIPPALAELFWRTGNLLHEIDHWLLRYAAASSALSRALLAGERAKLSDRLTMLEEQLRAAYENEMAQLRAMDEQASSNETETLILRHDSLSYLGRLQEQVKEKRLQF
jgi:hypothetical protein